MPCAGARSSAVRHVGNEPAAATPSITIQAAADAGSSIVALWSAPARWKRGADRTSGRSSVVQVDDSPLESERDSLGAPRDVELRHHVLEMHLHGLFGASDDTGDLAVSEPLRRETENLDLPRSEIESVSYTHLTLPTS